MHTDKPLLEVNGLTKHFMGVTALNDVSFEIQPGELVGLIGPNGSGKTTLFNCISGLLREDGGSVLFKGQDITHWRSDRIALAGIRRTFQDVHGFPEMTVIENLIISMQQHQEENLLSRAIRTRRVQEFEAQARQRALEILEMVDLMHVRDHLASELSYGQRKLLEFAAVLMPDPTLILLDEPTAAVTDLMIEKIMSHIVELNHKGKTFLIVEHNMNVIMRLSQRIVVLDHGQKIADGNPTEVRNNERVLEAYFGR